MVGAAMVNYAAPDPAVDLSHGAPLDVCNGHSVAFSGIRYDREGNALEQKLVEGGEGEEILMATFDLDALRAYRRVRHRRRRVPQARDVRGAGGRAPLPVFARADDVAGAP